MEYVANKLREHGGIKQRRAGYLLSSLAVLCLVGGGICPDANAADAKAKKDLAGIVLSVKGKWTLSGSNTPVTVGTSIPQGAMLKQASKDGSVVVTMTDGSVLKCPGCAACTKPVQVAKKEDWLTAALHMFCEKPTSWAVTEGRGGISEGAKVDVADGILKYDGQQVDLQPIVKQIPDGTYFLRLRATTDGEPGATVLGPVECEVAANKPIIVKASHLKAGVYKVCFSQDKEDPVGIEAWALLAPGAKFSEDQAAFESAVKASSSIKEATSENSARELLRAYMTALAHK